MISRIQILAFSQELLMDFRGSSCDHLNIWFFWSTICYEFIPIWIFEQFLQEYRQKVGWKMGGGELV